jgi:hypothetical protein
LSYTKLQLSSLESIGWASDYRLLVKSSKPEVTDDIEFKKDIRFAVDLVSFTKSLLCKSIKYFHFMQNLPFLLNSSQKGRDVLASYKNSARLREAQCNDMLGCIVEHFYAHSVLLQYIECQIVAAKIVELFPTEIVTKYIQKSVGRKGCRGKLYSKSQHAFRKIKKLGFNTFETKK